MMYLRLAGPCSKTLWLSFELWPPGASIQPPLVGAAGPVQRWLVETVGVLRFGRPSRTTTFLSGQVAAVCLVRRDSALGSFARHL